MNKLKGFVYALILIVISGFLINIYADTRLASASLIFKRYYSGESRTSSPKMLISTIDTGTVLVLGSSELYSDTDTPYCMFNMHNSENFNFIKVGKGGYQSIVHTGILGSIGNSIPSKKVVFFLSPQWFTSEGINPSALPGKLSLQHIDRYLKNENISKETKDAFIERILSLSSGFKGYNDDIKSLLKPEGYGKYEAKIKLIKEKIAQKLKLVYEYRNLDIKSESSERAEVPYEQRYLEAEKRAVEKTTNNDFGINNEYYIKYIKDKLDEFKNAKSDSISDTSPEFEDFRLFLKTARELGIEVQVHSIPLHGSWSDYIGLSKETRQKYYEKVNAIANEAGVEFIDLSVHEYNKHFLKDVMHLGELGWVIIDEEVTKFKNR